MAQGNTMSVHGTYEAEQEMLRLVREGDLSYKQHLNKMSTMGTMGKLGHTQDRHLKNAVLVCVVLFSRAAIDGGLSPETALTLTDHYFQSVEACQNIQELMEITYTMQDDFVMRVHQIRQSRNISSPIRTCADYMALHLEEDISLASLAKVTGYSEYYLSRRFKKEMGCTPAEYLRSKRMKRAKFLLKTTDLSVQEIVERLRFNSHSYFTDQFRRCENMTPSQYRELSRSGALPKEKGEDPT